MVDSPESGITQRMTSNRPQRVAEAIRKALSRILQQDISDPRIPAIFTITEVVVTKDLRQAKVYFSQLPDNEEDLVKTEEFLDASGGYLRSLVAHEVNTKFCPELLFEYDNSVANFQSVNEVLHDLRRKGEDLDSPPSDS